MVFAGGSVKDYTVEPPVGPNHPHSRERRGSPQRARPDDLHPRPRRRQRRSGIAASLRSQGFGVRRPLAFRSAQRIQAHGNRQGRERLPGTVVCAVYFIPVSGYVPDRVAIRWLAALRDAEVWMAPISGTRVLCRFGSRCRRRSARACCKRRDSSRCHPAAPRPERKRRDADRSCPGRSGDDNGPQTQRNRRTHYVPVIHRREALDFAVKTWLRDGLTFLTR